MVDYFSYRWCSRFVECIWICYRYSALGILAMNIAWLIVYTPKKNSQIFENTAKPTMYATIMVFYNVSFNEHT